MKNKMFSIIVTTINNPTLLKDYRKLADKRGLSMHIIVVPDHKTPEIARKLTKEVGGEYLERNLLGYHNDDARRQEGILRAIERNDDFIVLLDDDNFLDDKSWAHTISRVGDRIPFDAYYSDNNWVNPCVIMDKPGLLHRGFPFSKKEGNTFKREEMRKIVVNAGMWKNSADVDAIFHLTRDTKTTSIKGEIILGQEQFAPFNSQNTSILGETLPGYFFRPKREGEVTRYSDIFASYFYEKIMHHLGGTVLYGRPLSDHRRNIHNLLPEVIQEAQEMIILEDLLPSLENMKLTKDNWGDCLYEVVEQLKGEKEETKQFISFYKRETEKWLKLVNKLKI